jgi:putative glutamine amidotransferase
LSSEHELPEVRPRRPVVGITPDVGETAARPGRPSVPRYELKQAYADAVLAAGGLPIVLPYSEDESAPLEAVALCDAVVITGGAFDIPPELYKASKHRKLGALKPTRTQYEQRVLRAALDEGLPVLGICGGMQLLAVELGGTLWQDIRAELPQAFDHEQKHDPRDPAHPARIEPGTLLAEIVGALAIEVNSTHHQAVRDPGRARVSALSPDGVIEAIELSPDALPAPHEGARRAARRPQARRFAVGVQWHPELLATAEHLALYKALVKAAR